MGMNGKRRKRLAAGVVVGLWSAGAWACGGRAGSIDYAVPVGVCDTVTNSYRCAQAIEHLQLPGSPWVRRGGATLTVRSRSGKELRLTDVTASPDSTVWYSYRSFDPVLDHDIIHMQFYEGTAFLLISRRTLSRTPVPALPHPAPEGGRFAVTSRCLLSNYCPTSITIWALEPDSAALEWRFYPAGEPFPSRAGPGVWGPGNPEWRGPDTLLVPMIRVEEDFEERHTEMALTVTRRQGEWAIADTVRLLP